MEEQSATRISPVSERGRLISRRQMTSLGVGLTPEEGIGAGLTPGAGTGGGADPREWCWGWKNPASGKRVQLFVIATIKTTLFHVNLVRQPFLPLFRPVPCSTERRFQRLLHFAT